MKEGNEHLMLAGKYSRAAHNNWLIAMRESTPEGTRDDAMRAGDAAWIAADKHLRKHGVGVDDITDEEREMLLSDPCFSLDRSVAPEQEPELDFKPLERSYRLSLVVKTINRIFVIALIAGFAYLCGYDVGREAGAYPTAAELQQHLQQHKGE